MWTAGERATIHYNLIDHQLRHTGPYANSQSKEIYHQRRFENFDDPSQEAGKFFIDVLGFTDLIGIESVRSMSTKKVKSLLVTLRYFQDKWPIVGKYSSTGFGVCQDFEFYVRHRRNKLFSLQNELKNVTFQICGGYAPTFGISRTSPTSGMMFLAYT